MIGIIAAMDKEMDVLKAEMSEVDMQVISGLQFWIGKLSGVSVIAVRSGIGKVNAAMAAEVMSVVFKVDYIINTGIAGSLNSDINIGDIVLSVDAMEHDIDEGTGCEPGILSTLKESIYKADVKLREITKKVCEEVNPDINVFEGRVLSGDQFISTKEKKDFLVKQFGGICCEMEGAAIAHVSYLNNIPFIIIRSISDKADEASEFDYESFQ